jgi:hypothetical protein
MEIGGEKKSRKSMQNIFNRAQQRSWRSKARQQRKRRHKRRAMSENETERDFIEPMKRELGTIAGSFPCF